jgi:hypothetical protein
MMRQVKRRFNEPSSPAAPGQSSSLAASAAAAAAPAPEVTPPVPPPSKKAASSLARQLREEQTEGGRVSFSDNHLPLQDDPTLWTAAAQESEDDDMSVVFDQDL